MYTLEIYIMQTFKTFCQRLNNMNNALLQGALDIKYLQTREAKGKTWIDTFMAKHHRVVDSPLVQAQADLLQWQRGDLGGSGFFDCTVCVACD